jgi:hypothetical protein
MGKENSGTGKENKPVIYVSAPDLESLETAVGKKCNNYIITGGVSMFAENNKTVFVQAMMLVAPCACENIKPEADKQV